MKELPFVRLPSEQEHSGKILSKLGTNVPPVTFREHSFKLFKNVLKTFVQKHLYIVHGTFF